MVPKSKEILLSDKNSIKNIVNSRTNQTNADKPFKTEIVWRNVLAFIIIHYIAFDVPKYITWPLFWFHFMYGIIAGYGVVAGSHRLWAHRSYKANYKLQVLLMILQTICIQNDIIEWVRDHRVHHKFSDTDADPTNSNRGFFFSHMGWLMCKKHPDVRKYGSKVDMSDIESDPLLLFQRKYYLPLVLFLAFALPITLSMYIFSHGFYVGLVAVMARYVLSLHVVWLTNSVAHVGTWKPYDKNIAPADSKIFGTICYGEGWHNYHHVFPWDYKISEKPLYRNNIGMIFIDFFSWLGWATDLKVASPELIRKRVLRTGDGTHPYAIEEANRRKNCRDLDAENNNLQHDDQEVKTLWGLGDEDLPIEELNLIQTYCLKNE